MSTMENTGINYGKVVVRDAHGVVDSAATLSRINDELTAWIETNEIDMGTIATAVKAVFEKFPKSQKAQIDLNGLTNRALAELNVALGTETRIGERIKNFVRGESARFVETQGAEGSLMVRKGKSGGVLLATETFVKEYREGLAKKAAAAAK